MALAKQIAAITAREPRLLRRSAREVQAALDEDRALVRVADGELAAFLFYYRYGAWAEVASGWVSPDERGRGVFAELHADLLPRIFARGLRPFEFPGSDGVERALLRMGARRVPLSAMPAGVLARFVAARLAPAKLASYARAARAGTYRTSTRLYVFDDGAGAGAGAGERTTKGAATSTIRTTTKAD